jgi:hypothetical protein
MASLIRSPLFVRALIQRNARASLRAEDGFEKTKPAKMEQQTAGNS